MDSTDSPPGTGPEEPGNLEDLAATDRSGPEGARPVVREPVPVGTVKMPIEGGLAEVELSLVGTPPDDRIEATGIYVSSKRPVTTTMMRAPAWASLVEEAKRRLLSGAEESRSVDANIRRQRKAWPELSEETHQRMARGMAEAARAAISPLQAGLGRSGRPRELTPEKLAEVALVYSDAYRGGFRAPTRAVEKHFKVSRSTAARWVARTRELGLLPKTEQGIARGGSPAADEGSE